MVASRTLIASVPLEILLHFGAYYDALFVLVTIGVFIYKGYYLPYPSTSSFGTEISLVCILPVIEACWLFIGSKGNKTQTIGPLLTFCALSLPVLILYIYYIELQTYVLKIDHFLSIVGVVFLGLQLLLAIISILYINSARGIRAL